ncbi:hypothetical protein ONS95_011602 [Cadophora gregata]|uniref:uncharacterized protein n=1 Tax=Cadophora gregata TaxID=51156 RepID=UPI0026DAF058|nr:uncharacterized protein ONS95_011602 [Cadophora gregata]KAK0120196.1 hypothetical protein ONS95_011602 [Cadophora gregata]
MKFAAGLLLVMVGAGAAKSELLVEDRNGEVPMIVKPDIIAVQVSGFSGSGTTGTSAFPSYQCLPDTGPIIPHAFPWGQCGGVSWQGPFLCAPGWSCVVANAYFSTCVVNPGHSDASVSPTPNLAAPGSWCGATAIARKEPAECVKGFTCSGPCTYGYYACLRSPSIGT